VDYSALVVQIRSYIGDSADELDITDYADDLSQISVSSLDLVGHVKVQSTIRLHSNDPSFLETRNNLRWAKGSKIEFYARNSAGSLVLHRTFRILESKYNDQDSRKPFLTLDLGCLFALKDSRYPNPGDLRIPILENRPDVLVTITTNYWLRTFGLPEITTVAGDPVPTERIFTTGLYSGGSPIMEHIGQIIYLNSGCLLWVDPQERVRVRKVDLLPSQIDFTLERDSLLPNNRGTGEREKPAGTVRVLGVANYKYAYSDPPPQSTSSNVGVVVDGNLVKAFVTNETISVSTTGLSRVVLKRGTAVLGEGEESKLGQYSERTVEIFGGGFPEQPSSNPVLPPIPSVPAWLQSQTTTIKEQRLDENNELLPLVDTKITSINYSYRFSTTRQDGRIVRGVEVKQITKVTQILPEGETDLRVDEATVTDWIYQAPGIYTMVETTIRPFDLENRRRVRTIPASPDATPPATQFRPQTVVSTPVEIYGVARFEYPVGAPDNDHPRDYPSGAYIDRNQTATLRARELGALLIGRNEAQSLGFRPSDAWLADPKPLPIVAVRYNSTQQDVYMLDVAVLLLDKRRCTLGGNGIWLGRRVISTGVITPPYNIKRKVLAAGPGKAFRANSGKALEGTV
jgi:hypothetical protein